MTPIIIALLIFLSIILLLAEILLLPGVTIAIIGSIISLLAALYICFGAYGLGVTLLVFVISIIITTITTITVLKSKNIKKISLESVVDGIALTKADQLTYIGAIGKAQTRLAPMGQVIIDGIIIEAKSYDGYINPGESIKVTGFEDSVVIVTNKL